MTIGNSKRSISDWVGQLIARKVHQKLEKVITRLQTEGEGQSQTTGATKEATGGVQSKPRDARRYGEGKQ